MRTRPLDYFMDLVQYALEPLIISWTWCNMPQNPDYFMDLVHFAIT